MQKDLHEKPFDEGTLKKLDIFEACGFDAGDGIFNGVAVVAVGIYGDYPFFHGTSLPL